MYHSRLIRVIMSDNGFTKLPAFDLEMRNLQH